MSIRQCSRVQAGGKPAAVGSPGVSSRVRKSRVGGWTPWAAVVMLGVAIAAIWSPTIWRLVHDGGSTRVLGINDYPLHVSVAGDFSLFPYVNSAPHFLFHATTAVWNLIFSLQTAAVLSVCTAVTLGFVAVVILMRQPQRTGARLPLTYAAAVTLWFYLAESPGLFAIWFGLVPASSPIYTIHWWGNPTWLAAVPFLVLTLPLLEWTISEAIEESSDRRPAVLLFVVTVLGTIAKPALAIPLIPALPIYLLWVRRLTWPAARSVLLACALPAALLVLWQIWFLDASNASEFSSGFAVEFIVDAPFGWSNVGWVFLFPFLPVVLAFVLVGRDFVRDRSVQLLLVCLAFAVPLMLLVNETGERASHGNFAVPAQGCMALLVLVSVRLVATRVLVAWRSRSLLDSRVVLGIVLILGTAYTAGGILSLLDGAGIVAIPINWLDSI